jgi:hypothetical protein
MQNVVLCREECVGEVLICVACVHLYVAYAFTLCLVFSGALIDVFLQPSLG